MGGGCARRPPFVNRLEHVQNAPSRRCPASFSTSMVLVFGCGLHHNHEVPERRIFVVSKASWFRCARAPSRKAVRDICAAVIAVFQLVAGLSWRWELLLRRRCVAVVRLLRSLLTSSLADPLEISKHLRGRLLLPNELDVCQCAPSGFIVAGFHRLYILR